MGFLDNSSDIIIDMVITDLGRKILARGDGSFRVTRFAVCDDEIDYTLYDSSHASGSAYYDLEIMQTPIFEAFTNNTSTMKSKLISIPRNNLLYLPEIKINDIYDAGTDMFSTHDLFVACVDEATETALGATNTPGILLSETPSSGGGKIRVDQGLNTSEISSTYQLDPDLIETQYVVEMDSRFGSIVSSQSAQSAVPSAVDDDSIAFYNLTLNTDINYVKRNTETESASSQIISGPRGTYIEFKLKASIDLNTSTYLFTTLGTAVTPGAANDIFSSAIAAYYFIDSIIRVSGGSTGSVVDVPVRWVKLQ